MVSTRSSGHAAAPVSEPSAKSKGKVPVRDGGDPPASLKRPRDDAEQPVTTGKRFSGTINLYKRCGFGPPGSGTKPTKVLFNSGIVDTQEALETVAGKIRTYGFSGVKGPAGRFTFKDELVEAAKKRSIKFDKGTVLAFAVWDDRVGEANIAGVHAGADGRLKVTCEAKGTSGSAIDCSSGQRWASFVAVTVPPPAGGGKWKPDFVGSMRAASESSKLWQ